jgi:hypothetical protein
LYKKRSTMRKEPTVDDGRVIGQWVREHCRCCSVKQCKNKRRRRHTSISPTAIAMLIASISILFLDSNSLPVVHAASSHSNKAPYARDGSRSRSYHSPFYFSEEERILSALAETEGSYEDDDDDYDELADYSTENPMEDVDVDVDADVDRNVDEYSRHRPSAPKEIVREQTQYFTSPTRNESRRQGNNKNTTTLQEENTLQDIREEALRQRTLQYVSVPENYVVNRTASVRRTEPSIPDLTTPWVRQFMASCPKDVLLPVPRDYILDNFNLAQLAQVVEKISLQSNAESYDLSGRSSHPIYKQALRLILQEEPYDPITVPDTVQHAAKVLYLLIHQRYVLSPRGLDTVRRRFLLKQSLVSVDPIFGRCPRVVCQGMPLLPFGESDNYQVHGGGGGGRDTRAKRYCPSCGEGFYHWDSKVDGCAWGTSFCHLFVLTCGDEVFSEWKRLSRQPSSGTVVPRIFGFGLHASIQKRQA